MIDLVYKTLLTLLNKENNGYVSPTEFNILANKVQDARFKSYFESINRDRIREFRGLTSKGLGNLPFFERQKINVFADVSDISKIDNKFKLPENLMFIEDDGVVKMKDSYELSVIEEVERSVIGYLNGSLSKDSLNYEQRGDFLFVNSPDVDKIRVRYIRKPKKPNWTYRVIGGKEMFDPSNSSYQDFELHESEFPIIVEMMLKEFGITIREQEIIAVAEQSKNLTLNEENS